VDIARFSFARVATRATLSPMTEHEQKTFLSATLAMLRVVHESDGPDAAANVAKHLIYIAAAVIAREHGPDEVRRILRIAFTS
jgi:hypothetical protein